MPYFGVTPGTAAGADLDGKELILDADADTTITADTDDTIDIKIAGADDFQFTANTFTAQVGSTIAAQALTATTIDANGAVTIANGDIVFSTAGKGIVLGATTNVDANTLDDYEEGTWTPGITVGGLTTGVTYNAQLGLYIKVGKLVTCQFHLDINSNGSATGAINITGLPFTVSNTNNAAYGSSLVTNYRADFSADHYPGGYAEKNGTTIVMINLDPDATASSGLTHTDWLDQGNLYGQITYISA